MKVYNIGFLWSRKCNKECCYCDVFTKEGSNIVDIDYLEYIISLFDIPIHIELSGGEAGIIENFSDVIETFDNSKNVEKYSILSNGLVRKKYQNIVENSFRNNKLYQYQEHNIQEICGTQIIKNYEDLDLTNENWLSHIIVLTENSVNSLIDNYSYFKKTNMFNSNIFLKLLTPKNIIKYSISYQNKCKNLFGLLCDDNLKTLQITDNIQKIEYMNMDNSKYTNICSKYSNNSFVIIDEKIIGNCSMQVAKSQKIEITKNNIEKLYKGKLFTQPQIYCKNCIKFNKNAIQYIIDTTKKSYWNMEI